MVRRITLACLATLWLGLAQAAPPPIADFFKEPRFQDPKLSPDGKHVAFRSTPPGGRSGLAVIDLAKPDKAEVIASFVDADVSRVLWVNNRRLAYDSWDRMSGLDIHTAPGIWAIDFDGGDPRRLAYSTWDNPSGSNIGTRLIDRALPWNWVLQSALRDGSDDVLVEGHHFDNQGQFKNIELARLDTRSVTKRTIEPGPPGPATEWWADRQGRVAAVMVHDAGQSTLSVPEGTGWKAISNGNIFTGRGHTISTLVPGIAGTLYSIGVDPEHKLDTDVLARLDPSHPEAPPKVLLSLPGYDFSGSLVIDDKIGLLGVHFETDAPDTLWFNASMKAMQAEIDKLLPGTVNQIACDSCLNGDGVLVTSFSDRQPPILYYFERSTRKLRTLLHSRPWIPADDMGRREPLMYKTRDGLSIPMMVTHPAGAEHGKRPAVMLVHGGPWARGNHWADWRGPAEAQFLASRGYLVIEPEFRGSKGYGDKLYRAGFKQWGLAMQDDVSDAMDALVAKGLVDPKRVCIGGASYGGYAALMGLAKEPDRYRCGFEWAGVTDIQLMYSRVWSDFDDAYKDYGMPEMVGDQVKDAEQIRNTSPIHLATRINKPLLMAYGGDDRRVPAKHGEELRDAIQAHNKDVEWVLYPNEGHSWRALKTNVDFWGRVEKLLARTIGDGAKP
ncbi:MAG TPA: prolyl oligopeptidase family serine peptidase [Burkholderiaceae bacterium]|jgi:dipeptidyl aminopeptidase/acylaminoacyl peptidase